MSLWDAIQALSGVLGIVGFFAAFWMYSQQKRRALLLWTSVSSPIITFDNSELADDVRIYSGHREIRSLFVTSIYIWNVGNVPIRRADIAERDKIRISCRDASVLGRFRANGSNLRCGAEVFLEDVPRGQTVIDQRSLVARVEFDYLDPGDGLRFTVSHENKDGVFQVSGSLIGFKSGIMLSSEWKAAGWFGRVEKMGAKLLPNLTAIVSAALASLSIPFPWEFREDALGGVLLLIFALLFVGAVVVVVSYRRGRMAEPPVSIAP